MHKFFTTFSRRERTHEVAEDDHNVGGAAVEMKDDDENHGCASSFDVDIGGDKNKMLFIFGRC